MLQAWIEVCHKFVGGEKVQTMWNLQKNVWYMMSMKYFLVKKFKNRLNVDLPRQKHIDSPVKKRLPA